MKSTGIIRKVDDLGRIVLPIELRRTLDIAERDELEIFMESDRIVLQKYEPACIFCGSSRALTTYNRNTGACSEQKSLIISTGVTLLRGMMMLAGGAVLLGSVMHCMRRKMRKKMLCAQKAVTKRPKK